MKHLGLTVVAIAALLAGVAQSAPAADHMWTPDKGEHIVIIGSGVADRMQHHGWLEAHLQAAYPGHNLVIRNNGFAGDRIDKRPRNRGFMSADDYLTHCKADTVFAMFGYNESYDANPADFKKKVIKFIDDTRGKKYNGKGAPKIVLFSPIAHENLKDPNLPNGKKNNQRLAAYTEAMQAAAKEKGVKFVNLFGPSLKLYKQAKSPLTTNGIHPNETGSHRIARVITRALTGKEVTTDSEKVDAIRKAVLDKNWHWFNRYRATDGNDVWGGRSGLKFTDGQTNREVLQHELVQLDVMSANRDKVIWAATNGKMIKADDSNVPPAIPVKTNLHAPNKKQANKIGKLDYLTPEESLAKLKLADGLKGNVFASEQMFPEHLANPVQLGVDTKGRLWAATWGTYPKWEPLKQMNDQLVILPDENRDGVADKAITFAHVHNPTGFCFWNGGVIVANQPDILFLKDIDGDDVADIRFRIVSAIDSADTHHAANNFTMGPDGFVYFQRGVFHVSNVETPWVTNQTSGTSGVYRFNPRTHEFSFHAPNSPNPHGISFDYWGYHYITDGTGGQAKQVKPNGKGGFSVRNLLKKTVRPVPSSGILSSAHLPDEYEGDFVILNAIGFLGIKQYDLAFDTKTGDANGTISQDLMVSGDRNFRPTDFEIGDDGALYVSDWANAIVGHMQHNIRDPSRDKKHGRIIRVTAEGRPLSPHVPIDGQPIEKLLDLLKHPVNGVRERARVELSEHDTKAVMDALAKWLKQFNASTKDDAHHLLEGLWLHQQFNVKNEELLKQMLNSPEPHARIAAARVKQMWEHNKSQPVIAVEEGHGDKPAAKAPADAIVIETVLQLMKYKQDTITVKAGQKVKVWFHNVDHLPHNILFVKPGTVEAVATAAEKLGPKGFEVGFVPNDGNILKASKLIGFQETELIEFTAPAEPGDYEYVCTFPGHWRTMRGVMKVVK